MAKLASAAYCKRLFKGKKVMEPQQEPREGSRLRRLWDGLMANKGEAIDALAIYSQDGEPIRLARNHISGDIAKLTDFYGLDIRKFPHWHKGHVVIMLAGEWHGTQYVNYMELEQEP